MAIKLTEEEVQLFYNNGFFDEDISNAINEAKENGLTDKQIRKNIDNKIKELGGEVKFNPFGATPEELNEEYKKLAQEKLDARNEWENAHPHISRLQEDYLPFYRANRTALERRADYGLNIPKEELTKSLTNEAGQAVIPYINLGRDAALTYFTKGKRGFLPTILTDMGISAVQSSTADALDEISKNGVENALEKARNGLINGGETAGGISLLVNSLPYAKKIPAVKNAADYLDRVGSGLSRGFLESFAMGKNVVDRLKTGPRGTEISKKADYYGDPEYLNNIARRFKDGLSTFKNQEREAFNTAKDALIKNNKNEVDISLILDDTFKNLFDSGLIDENGVTRAGARAVNLQTFLDDINAYRGKKMSVENLQNFKTDILDDIIDYRPEAGKNLNKATSKLQNIAKGARYNINSLLQETLGPTYAQANKKIANILDVLDKTPELKDLTNTNNIDTLANKLKQAGTVRFQTRKELNNLENLMAKNGVKISDNSLVDDILDFQAAKEIKERIRTGQDADKRNIARKAFIQPATEFYIDRIIPAAKEIRKISPTIQSLLKPMTIKNISNMVTAYKEDK